MPRVPSILFIAILIIELVSVGNAQQTRSSVLDRSQEDLPETIVMPAGTKITVDIAEENPPRNVSRAHFGKVIDIVQVGSAVAIPALSKVTVQHSAGTMELTEVTIDHVHYKLQTDRVTLEDGSMSEATFTTTRPITIKR